MAATPDVKQLLLQVDASVELLRRNLTAGQAQIDRFAGDTQRRLDGVDRRFGELGRPLGNINTSIEAARREITSLGASVEQSESRIRRSAGAIKAALLGSAAGLASAFTVDRVKDYADAYTRYTNQLRVAGLEGEQLTNVQNRLYVTAQKYGIELESVGTLYGRASQAATALGASQGELLQFTNGVGAALKVQGGSAESAQGALLQLSQLLAAGTVHAEEFNSVNEGARPILQAVANGVERYKGSVAALRAEVLDGKLSSAEFFQGFLKGSGQLEAQAAKSNLTIGASLTILNNALGKYIGETDAGLSATQRVSSAIVALSNNLDLIAPALAVVGVGLATRFSIAPIAAATAQIALMGKALDSERLVMIGGKVAAAQKAEATAAAARVEVAAIEATIASRRADQASLQQSLALVEAQRASALQAQAAMKVNQSLGFGTAVGYGRNDALRANQDLKTLITTRRALGASSAELAALEKALAAAQVQAAATTRIASVAAREATVTARAAAAASRLFAGSLTLIGGSVAGGAAVLAIGALAAAIMHANSVMADAEERSKATETAFRNNAAAARELERSMADVAKSASGAASSIAQVGGQAAASTVKVRSFAGALGEAADKLYALAKARRHEQVISLTTQSVQAEQQANEAQARISARAGLVSSRGVRGIAGEYTAAEKREDDQDRVTLAAARRRQGDAYRSAQQAAAIPLESRIRESDRNGGRDVDGELARVTRDLVVARERGLRGQIDALEAQRFELTQYKKYRKSGLSAEAAQQAASSDAGSFRSASAGAQGDRNARAGRTASNKADREARAADRRVKAEVRDAAADERAFSSAERQANNDIATARAELTNSAVERAKIEKDRIEAERQNRNNEIEQQAKQGGLGEGAVAETRKLQLQRLNTERAALETQVVDARERQRIADEQLSLSQAESGNQRDLLQAQSNLATTSAERRRLELAILDITYAEERARLDAVVASRDTTETEKKIARARLAVLEQLKGAEAVGIDRQNAGPLDQYRERLRQATGDMGQAIEEVEVNGLDSLTQSLTAIVTGTESVSSAFKKMAASIISDLIRIAAQKAILSIIGGGFAGFAGGGRISDAPGFANGGSPGGLIRGPGTGRSDSILAMLSDGKGPIRISSDEFIVNAAATKQHLPLLQAINGGRLPKFATGGLVSGQRVPHRLRAPSLPEMARGNQRQTLTVEGEIKVSPTPELDARLEQVSFRTAASTAEPIMAGATARTIRHLNRPDLPGAPI